MKADQSGANANDQSSKTSRIPGCDHVTFPSNPHALPFRTILSEHFIRRPRDLARVRANLRNIPLPPPFNKDDPKSRSAWGKFCHQQWRQLQGEIEASEEAYQSLADEKENLSALSAANAIVLLGEHRRTIRNLTKQIGELDKKISSAQGEEKKKLEIEKQEREQALREERAQKRAHKLQQQVADAYQNVLDAERKCKDSDQLLLPLLHGMEASAVCLSGGGIRSASFCLGVLQGMARFSVKRRHNTERIPALEGLDRSALEGLDYISTVSGGGYIGSWLIAWASRHRYTKVIGSLANPTGTSGDPESQPIRHLREYTSYLTPRYGFTLDSFTVLMIVLRNLLLNWTILIPAMVFFFCVPYFFYQVSSLILQFLSGPRVFDGSLIIGGVCASCATFFISQSTFRPAYASETRDASNLGRTSREVCWLILPLLIGAWIISEGAACVIQQAPSPPLSWWTLHFAFFAVLPPMVMAFTRVWWQLPRMGLKTETPLRRPPGKLSESSGQEPASREGLFESFLPFQIWVNTVYWRRLIWALIAPLMIGLLIAFTLGACAKYVPILGPPPGHVHVGDQAFFWLSVPLILSVLLLASAFLSGLLSGIETEEEREWWARAGGLIIMFILGWIALLGLAFYAGTVFSGIRAGILAAFGLAAGSLGSLAGLSAATSFGVKKVKLEQLTSLQRWLAKNDLFAPFACAVAIVCISLALAAATSGLRNKLTSYLENEHCRLCSSVAAAEPKSSDTALGATSVTHQRGNGTDDPLPVPAKNTVPVNIRAAAIGAVGGVSAGVSGPTTIPGAGSSTASAQKHHSPFHLCEFLADVGLALIALVIALLANGFINVNTFSLHGMYRMRLTRAYLGASNFARHPDNFTNFDASDNRHEAALVRHNAPLHVINTTLNLVATANLAWQQRKGESFTFSPISVGSWRLGYLPTSMYGGGEGVTLGTAMSISGAAFNPNMGYNSSPLVMLLMTFFNARLGWWLPNPIWPLLKSKRVNSEKLSSVDVAPTKLESLLRQEEWVASYLRSNSPTGFLAPLRTLINEAFGRTDSKYKWIELTDGGHFENLGLYEMVMRRCRYIIVVDSDADKDCNFEDLGNAIRKIEIDFGIPIRFPKYPSGLPMKHGLDGSNAYYAVGDIFYDSVDKDPSSGLRSEQQGIYNGKLLYIKPCLNGGEPQSIRAYANAHSTFPHESTINQFFNEAQFESYRSLGSWEFASMVDEAGSSNKVGNDIQTLFDIVESRVPRVTTPPKPKNFWETVKEALGLSRKENFESGAEPQNKNK